MAINKKEKRTPSPMGRRILAHNKKVGAEKAKKTRETKKTESVERKQKKIKQAVGVTQGKTESTKSRGRRIGGKNVRTKKVYTEKLEAAGKGKRVKSERKGLKPEVKSGIIHTGENFEGVNHPDVDKKFVSKITSSKSHKSMIKEGFIPQKVIISKRKDGSTHYIKYYVHSKTGKVASASWNHKPGEDLNKFDKNSRGGIYHGGKATKEQVASVSEKKKGYAKGQQIMAARKRQGIEQRKATMERKKAQKGKFAQAEA